MSAHESGGRAFVFGDNVDTDTLAPGLYMKGPIETLAQHCLEALDPTFSRTVRPGDIVVAGENFGMGSSREQAVMALRQLGVTVIIAKSFAGLFFRNALNLGVIAMACADADRIRAGDRLAVEMEAARIRNLTTSESYACDPIPPHLVAMIRDGGLIPHLAKTRERPKA